MALDNQNGANEPIRFKSSYASSQTAWAAGAVMTVFTPAANVNGAVLHAAGVTSALGGGEQARVAVIAKTSAPASFIDGSVIAMSDANYSWSGSSGWTVVCRVDVERPVFIEPGQGLYLYNGASTAIAAYVNALFTLL